MNKEIKLNSVEGGPFTASQNRITFEIPSDGVYDLNSSYINLNCQISVTEASTVGGVGIYPMDLEFNQTVGTSKAQYPNASVVKNCYIRSARYGMIENIRRNDQLQNILYILNKSENEKDSRSYDAASQIAGPFNVSQYGIYRDLNKLGNIKSKQNDIAPVKIPLRDLFDFCYQGIEVDTSKSGTITVQCELNGDLLQPIQRMKSNLWSEGIKHAFGDLTTAGGANRIVTTNKVTNLNQSPYYTGQKLNLTATGGGGAGDVDTNVVVEAVFWNTDGTISLDFEQNWGTIGAGESYSAIQVETVNVASSSVSINFGELVLLKLAKDKSDFQQIQYSTYSTEETNGNGLTNYQNQFQIEADSDAVIIAFPNDNGDILSKNVNLNDYRLRLDNVDLTDRNVNFDSPLHYDRLNMSMTQLGMRLKSLAENSRSSTANTYLESVRIGDTKNNLIMSPVEQKIQEKLLQVNIDAGGTGVKKITLFKHLPRVFSY